MNDNQDQPSPWREPSDGCCPQCGMFLHPSTPRCSYCVERNRATEMVRQNAKAHKADPARLYADLTGADLALVERWFTNRRHQLTAIAANKLIRGRCSKYGLTTGQWLALIAQQRSTCAICATELPPLKLCIDHDHATGAVRGLLCQSCNTGIGLLGIDGSEAIPRGRALSTYLRRFVLSHNRNNRVPSGVPPC